MFVQYVVTTTIFNSQTKLRVQCIRSNKFKNANPGYVTKILSANVQYWSIYPIRSSEQKPGQAVAVKALLGCNFFGNCIDGSKIYAVSILNFQTSDGVMHELFKRFGKVEGSWNKSDREFGMSPSDKRCLEKLQKERKLTKGKRKTPML